MASQPDENLQVVKSDVNPGFLESDDENDEADESPEIRRAARQQEWGQQWDKWLIKASRKRSVVELCLVYPFPGVTRDQNLVDCVPIRVDKYMVQVLVDNTEVWINKMWVLGCKPMAGKVKVVAVEDN